MKIRMVDTITQYEKIKEEVDSAVSEVVQSAIYINGPVVQSFRKDLADFLDVSHVIACANGTDALQVALMALDLEPGDEVITPAFTYIATVEVIALLRLRPVFVDVEPDTFNMDVSKIEAAISDRTKVILPVHLFGQAANMAPIMEIARKHGLSVVEDTAQSIGSDYHFPDGKVVKTGTIGDIGTTSFYPSKNLGAYGDGGAIFSGNDELAKKIQMICNHGSTKRYYHDSIGVNSRLDAIQAAVLQVKLKHLDRYNASRIAAADRYDALLADVDELEIPKRASNSKHVFHQYTLKVKAGRDLRDKVKAQMDEWGIPTMIYYPLCCHEQPAYLDYGFKRGDFPVSEQLTAEVLSLPMHSELDEEQQKYIVDHLLRALRT
ncbi:MAG: DegT/DnrJ/EryC1/StrS family aminotransferase [Bacteroidia bacterium]|nr:DegT/DnrJ/EryC1/StrS family aminotransferase [Bacteroidia bacterium]